MSNKKNNKLLSFEEFKKTLLNFPELTFSGGGDSGGIDGFVYHNQHLADFVEELCLDTLDMGGWDGNFYAIGTCEMTEEGLEIFGEDHDGDNTLTVGTRVVKITLTKEDIETIKFSGDTFNVYFEDDGVFVNAIRTPGKIGIFLPERSESLEEKLVHTLQSSLEDAVKDFEQEELDWGHISGYIQLSEEPVQEAVINFEKDTIKGIYRIVYYEDMYESYLENNQ